MPRPSDQIQGTDPSDGSPDTGRPLVRKVAMIDPGFREETESSVLRPRILGIKKPSHPHDRNNLKFLGVACFVAVVIFAILEYKQYREAASEGGPAAPGLSGSR